jgi:hypothetical protein
MTHAGAVLVAWHGYALSRPSRMTIPPRPLCITEGENDNLSTAYTLHIERVLPAYTIEMSARSPEVVAPLAERCVQPETRVSVTINSPHVELEERDAVKVVPEPKGIRRWHACASGSIPVSHVLNLSPSASTPAVHHTRKGDCPNPIRPLNLAVYDGHYRKIVTRFGDSCPCSHRTRAVEADLDLVGYSRET